MNSAPQPLSEREQTDESLRVERERADRTLEDHLAIADETADVVISRARALADALLAAARSKTDSAITGEQPSDTLKTARALEEELMPVWGVSVFTSPPLPCRPAT